MQYLKYIIYKERDHMTKLMQSVIKQQPKEVLKDKINKNVADLKKTIKESDKNA